MQPILVSANRQGQLCNHQWLFGPIWALAVAHGCQVGNPAFGGYAHDFEAITPDGRCRWLASGFSLRARWFRRGPYFLFRGWRRALRWAGTSRLKVVLGEVAGEGAVKFLISSDEPQERATFGDLDVTFCRGHELEDVYALAGCDRIVGPPSTYSAWAAFVGRCPLYHIRRVDHRPELEDFRDNSFL